MRFRLVPESSTLDDLERPKCTLLQKRCVFWSHCQGLEKCLGLGPSMPRSWSRSWEKWKGLGLISDWKPNVLVSSRTSSSHLHPWMLVPSNALNWMCNSPVHILYSHTLQSVHWIVSMLHTLSHIRHGTHRPAISWMNIRLRVFTDCLTNLYRLHFATLGAFLTFHCVKMHRESNHLQVHGRQRGS